MGELFISGSSPMLSTAKTVEEYVIEPPGERPEVMKKLCEVVGSHIPDIFFEDGTGYGMMG